MAESSSRSSILAEQVMSYLAYLEGVSGTERERQWFLFRSSKSLLDDIHQRYLEASLFFAVSMPPPKKRPEDRKGELNDRKRATSISASRSK